MPCGCPLPLLTKARTPLFSGFEEQSPDGRPAGTRLPKASIGVDDAFFRQIVTGMRNGVLAITRDGRLAVINDEAYRHRQPRR